MADISVVSQELKDFFEVLPNILADPDSVFSFWNGLGATSKTFALNGMTTPAYHLRISDPTIYDVASNLADLHLDDVGMKVRILVQLEQLHRIANLIDSHRLNGTTSLSMRLSQRQRGRVSSGNTGT